MTNNLSRCHTVLVLAFALLLIAPTAVWACNIPIRTVGALNLSRKDLRRPIYRKVERSQWPKALAGETSVMPTLDQFVRIKNRQSYYGVTFAWQQAFSIDAISPGYRGEVFAQDDDPQAPACALLGKYPWTAPRILVKESEREVRITAVSSPTAGDTAGCVLEQPDWDLMCPNITVSVVTTREPLGKRRLVLERFV
jgi:hypothetical protein